jgi:hypothetical protein
MTYAGALAAALNVPVCALTIPDGYEAVTEVVLTPESVARVRSGGEPVARELAALVHAQLPALILQACREPLRPKPGRPRRQRTRSQGQSRRDAVAA